MILDVEGILAVAKTLSTLNRFLRKNRVETSHSSLVSSHALLLSWIAVLSGLDNVSFPCLYWFPEVLKSKVFWLQVIKIHMELTTPERDLLVEWLN